MVPNLESMIAVDAEKKDEKKRSKQQEEKDALRARLVELEEGRAQVEPQPVPAANQAGKTRGKPPKRKI